MIYVAESVTASALVCVAPPATTALRSLIP